MRESVKKLISSSILLTLEAREHWLEKVDTLTNEQCAEVEKALLRSQEDLKTILQKPENQEKLEKVKDELDRVWKIYTKDIEQLSRSQEESMTESLLNQL